MMPASEAPGGLIAVVLKIAKSVLIFWAAPFALLTIPQLFGEQSLVRILYALAAVILLASAIGCIKNIRWCWWPVVGIGMLSICRWLPMVAHNFHRMYWADDQLYHDSPGTGIIVMLYAAVFVIPPAIIILCLSVELMKAFLFPTRAPSTVAR
jgi:hypothetical protein